MNQYCISAGSTVQTTPHNDINVHSPTDDLLACDSLVTASFIFSMLSACVFAIEDFTISSMCLFRVSIMRVEYRKIDITQINSVIAIPAGKARVNAAPQK
jgi:hypothetical protein